MTFPELTLAILTELLRKSGVREWDEPEARQALTLAAMEMAANILQNEPGFRMALPDNALIQTGTEIAFKNSGGSAAISLSSVANAAGRQSVKADFGATRARFYDVFAEVELAATPTAGNLIDVYLNPSSSATAGTDNLANCDGTDAAYAGYSSNLAASVPQLIYCGSLVCTTQTTATVQKGFVGRVQVPQRYGSIVVVNNSGAAFHSSNTNNQIRFVPVADVVTD